MLIKLSVSWDKEEEVELTEKQTHDLLNYLLTNYSTTTESKSIIHHIKNDLPLTFESLNDYKMKLWLEK